MVLYIGSAVAKRPMEKVVKATLPFYLYAGQGRAFLLPDGQADSADSEVWEFISARTSLTG